MQLEGVLSQAAVVGVPGGRRVAFADAGNADIVGLAGVKFRGNKVRERRVDGIVDSLIAFFQSAVDVNFLAELIHDVEVIVRVANDDRFAGIKRDDLSVVANKDNFAGFVEQFHFQIEVRVIVSRRVIETGELSVFNVGMTARVPAEIPVNETVIGAVAADVDNVFSTVRSEREDVVVGAFFDNTVDVIGSGVRIVRVNIDANVVVFKRRGSFDRVSEKIVAEPERGGDDRDIVLEIRRADVLALAPLRHRGGIRSAHDRAPGSVATIDHVEIFVVLVTVVTES